MEMLSPVSGIIKVINRIGNRTTIGIYIRGPNDKIQDDHNIYSPLDGKLKYSYYHGKIKGHKFLSDLNKIGYVKFEIINKDVIFHIYVGKGYVTNQIKLLKENKTKIKRSEKIGEIVIDPSNSYAEIFFENKYKVNVSKNDVVIGGKSILGLAKMKRNKKERKKERKQ